MSWLLVTASRRDAVEPFGVYCDTLSFATIVRSLTSLPSLLSPCSYISSETRFISACLGAVKCTTPLQAQLFLDMGILTAARLQPAGGRADMNYHCIICYQRPPLGLVSAPRLHAVSLARRYSWPRPGQAAGIRGRWRCSCSRRGAVGQQSPHGTSHLRTLYVARQPKARSDIHGHRILTSRLVGIAQIGRAHV